TSNKQNYPKNDLKVCDGFSAIYRAKINRDTSGKKHPLKDNCADLHKNEHRLSRENFFPARVMGQAKRARLVVQRAHPWHAKVYFRQRAYWVGYLNRVGSKKVAIR
ncbi:TPA: hypothetical protein ACGF8K_003611, partial [Vibrio cholerae]